MSMAAGQVLAALTMEEKNSLCEEAKKMSLAPLCEEQQRK